MSNIFHLQFKDLPQAELTCTYRTPQHFRMDMTGLASAYFWLEHPTMPADMPYGDLTWLFVNLPAIRYPVSEDAFEIIATPTKQIRLLEKLAQWYETHCIGTQEEEQKYCYGGSPADANSFNIYAPMMRPLWDRELNLKGKESSWQYYFFNYQKTVHIRALSITKEKSYALAGEYRLSLADFDRQMADFTASYLKTLQDRVTALHTFDMNTHEKAQDYSLEAPQLDSIVLQLADYQQKYNSTLFQQQKEFDWAAWLWKIQHYL